ncbi:MAG: flagellar assembly protein FliW [Thermoguttaceae bacterium]|jgi:flagellar assembly factor FliW
MKIITRFGPMDVDADDELYFPSGLVGLEACRRWVVLADRHSEALAWLQSVDRPEIALGVTSPRRFVPGYQIRVARRDLTPLALDEPAAAKVLVIVGQTARGATLNLKAPVIINLQRSLGRQVVANGDLPIRYELGKIVVMGRVGESNHSIEHKGRSHRCLSYPDNAMKAS